MQKPALPILKGKLQKMAGSEVLALFKLLPAFVLHFLVMLLHPGNGLPDNGNNKKNKEDKRKAIVVQKMFHAELYGCFI